MSNLQKVGLCLLLSMCVFLPSFAGTSKYRLTLRDNPATSMTIGWVQDSGSNPVVYYGTQDFGTNYQSYPNSKSVDRSVGARGMNHRFARLVGLQPDTAYYFVIVDSDSVSNRFWFKTAAADDSSFTIIAGGDSRNNQSVRIRANKMVAKLRPTAVFFGGDMTDQDSNSQWQTWLNDWQYTIAGDGRMFPVVAARGNHESTNSVIHDIFDTPHDRNFYALTFGTLLRAYTLNSEDTEGGTQASWLADDLAANQGLVWRTAQYHKPMRPHVSSKSEGWDEYDAWADLFYQNQVQLVVECDSHCVKATWPIRPSSASGNDEGFVRDDAAGTVYVGEGTWGAPLRTANDGKSWTRASASFNQFKWILVAGDRLEIKTVRYDNVDSVGSVSDSSPWSEPSGIDLWQPSSGGTITILNQNVDAPAVAFSQPNDGDFFNSGDQVDVVVDVSVDSGNIAQVQLYVDQTLIGSDSSAPYQFSWTATRNGAHTLRARALSSEGVDAEASIQIQVGVQTIQRRIASGNDDAEERSDGSMYLDSSDLELIADGSRDQVVGLRFTNLVIPAGSVIESATIQFTVDETDSGSADLLISAQADGNPGSFTSSSGNISSRVAGSSQVAWQPPAWSSVGAAGSDQRTPDLSALLQEVVDRGDWQSGNAVVFLIEGSGERTAEAYEGSSSAAPLLTVTFRGDDGGQTGNDGLQNGIPVQGLSGAKDEQSIYFYEVPAQAEALNISIAGGNGDADLYVRFGAEPTLNLYDYRPYLNGNNETVNVGAPAEGTWYVMLHGYNAYSGLSLTASHQEAGSGGAFYENTQSQAIPDNQSVGISSTIQVDSDQSTARVQVGINITHTYIGDLIVTLRAPDGTTWTLHNREGGSSDNLVNNYTVDLPALNDQGPWILTVSDRAGRDVGTLQSWSLSFQ